eukprot:814516-Rhodomonas_salina.3
MRQQDEAVRVLKEAGAKETQDEVTANVHDWSGEGSDGWAIWRAGWPDESLSCCKHERCSGYPCARAVGPGSRHQLQGQGDTSLRVGLWVEWRSDGISAKMKYKNEELRVLKAAGAKETQDR